MKLTIFILLIASTFGKYCIAQDSENFDSFFFKFATDEEFQLERTKFPLKFVTWDNPTEIGGEIVTKYIDQENWEHNYFYMNQNERPQIYDNHEGKLRDTDERLFQWIGIETGTNAKYFFKRINGLWFLVEMENLGD